MKRHILLILGLLVAFQVEAAFPTLRSSSKGREIANVTNHTVTLPATVESGDLLACFYSQDGTVSITWDDVTEGAWTEKNNTPIDTARHYVTVLVADGTEDAATLTIVSGNAQQSSFVCLAIQSWEGTLAGVEIGTVATEFFPGGVNPDPPNLAPSWGDKDNLYIAIFSSDSDSTVSVYSLPDNNLSQVGSAGGATTGVSTDELTGAAQNPGAYTISDAEDWAAQTMVVEPASSSVAPYRRRQMQ